MSVHIVDDEQRSDRRATPMRPSGSGGAGASAALALLDDVHEHRLRRAALHLPPRRSERGPSSFSDRLLERPAELPERARPAAGKGFAYRSGSRCNNVAPLPETNLCPRERPLLHCVRRVNAQMSEAPF